MQGADVVYSDIADQLHASGHGNREDLKFLMRFTNPKYFIPIGGTIRHQQQYRQLAEGLGFDGKKVMLLSEGETVLFQKDSASMGENLDTKSIYVDAYGVGDIGSVVLRDRKTLSSDGMVVAVLALNSEGLLAARPKFISKGFVFEKNETELFNKAAIVIATELKPHGGKVSDFTKIKRDIIDKLETFFYKQRGRKPLIIVETLDI